MKKILMVVGALLLAISLPLTSSAASKQYFSDVASSQHFAEAVNELAARSIIGGYPDGTFKPGNSITRGQAAAIIVKMRRLDTTNVKNPGFTDVSTANGYYQAIATLAEAGIISGYGNGRYGPNDSVTRGQFASILVKAFDLPRYPFFSIKNPFKDVHISQSHAENILILYKLGITTGTTPTTFGINTAVTRGQAAKLLKATENTKPSMVTLEAEDVGMDTIHGVIWKTDEDLYESVEVYGKPGYTKTKIQLLPLREGKGTLNVAGSMKDGSSATKKYYVHIKKVSGALKLTLEETDDYLPTDAPLEISTGEKIQHVSLSTVEGKKVADNVAFKNCPSNVSWPDYTCIKVDQPGDYIATARLTSGENVRYAIQATVPKGEYFAYDVQTLRERNTYTFDVEKIFERDEYYDKEAAKQIGEHTFYKNNEKGIAIVTRDPGTNVFHVTAKKVGTVSMDFERPVEGRLGQIGDDTSGRTTGMIIEVKQLNGLLGIEPRKLFEYYQ